MGDDELKAQLKRWGHATVSRFALQYDGPSAGDSVLAKQRDLGLKSKLKRDDERELVKRDGSARRRTMAAAAGVRGLSMVPLWACEPIRAANDADPPHDRAPAFVDVGLPDDVRWVEGALARIAADNPIRAACIREEFCGTGTQRMKASRVARLYGGTLSVWMYRREIDLGLEWLRARKAA